ncbi:hypothetical protein [Haloarcula sp. JP-Z28]|uniref:hypothetical protein n=1 Tax=Haloarcula sp. JP-Z28 TaxID=2716715 RepID=UPI0018781AD4|nr:hypothetical protein [Haloarcula sp. JP-Z28]
MDAEWDSYQSDEFHCRDCGEEFPNEEAAKEHLRKAQKDVCFWLMGLPEAKWRDAPLPDFNDESAVSRRSPRPQGARASDWSEARRE